MSGICINRNILECKDIYEETFWDRSSSINRNILECKEMQGVRKTQTEIVLIETYWNVKIILLNTREKKENVLIETYWNVKNKIYAGQKLRVKVLIETYWNVKCSR